jgi:hypothetical protein
MKAGRVKPPGNHETERALLIQFIVKKQTQVITLQKVFAIKTPSPEVVLSVIHRMLA